MGYQEFTIEGRNAVIEAYRAGKPIDKLFILDGCQDGPMMTIKREAKKHDTLVKYVTKERLDQLSETGKHQGVIAYAAAYEYAEVDDILEGARKKGEPPFIFLLDNIEDPHNLGAIIRTANLAGAHGVIIPKNRAAGLTATVARTSAGALNYTPVAKVTNLAKTIEEELTKDDGIIFKYARDDGTLKFTEQQKAILSNMPAEAAVGFRNMALGSEESAESVAPYASRIIALSMTYSLMRELNGIIKQMAVGLSDEQAAVIKDMIADSEKRIDTEYQLLLTEYGTLSDLSNHIDNKLRNMEYPDPIHPKNPLVVTYPVN